MAAKGQALRPSQYITTFGPGSILETPDGPVIIAAPSHSGLFDETHPEEYEIRDLRLSETLLEGKKIFRIPSNADLGINEDRPVYNTYHFPNWSLCASHGILYRYKLKSSFGCPKCDQERPTKNWGEVWAKSREEAVRFVLACCYGHLNDVPWRSLVKHRSGCSKKSDHLLWQGGGGALRNVKITCPECRASTDFGGPQGVYSREFPCYGCFPEENNRRVECNKPAKIIQRGAANLRISEIRSALTIPPLDTGLHRLLQSRAIVDAIVLINPVDSKELFVRNLDKLVTAKRLDPTIAATIKQYEEPELLGAIRDIIDEIENPRNLTEATLRQDEFLSLRNAASDGAPPQRSDKPGGPNQFEVYRENVREFVLDSGRTLRVTPLSRLRVVMVQVGYTRPIDTGKDEEGEEDSQPPVPIVPVEYLPPNESIAWHPGVELFGEGVFLDFVSETEPRGVSEHFPLRGEAGNLWLAASSQSDNRYRKIKAMPGVKLDYLHPVFVWWHTLSHRLIAALSVDSGYSSAAIRERVYAFTIDKKTVGGLLLYTAQSGGDGTLGGLIGLVPHFERILKSALRNLDACSNDPICIEEKFGEDRVNGAACYACQLVSETSCEHRNTLLDRSLLLENKP